MTVTLSAAETLDWYSNPALLEATLAIAALLGLCGHTTTVRPCLDVLRVRVKQVMGATQCST